MALPPTWLNTYFDWNALLPPLPFPTASDHTLTAEARAERARAFVSVALRTKGYTRDATAKRVLSVLSAASTGLYFVLGSEAEAVAANRLTEREVATLSDHATSPGAARAILTQWQRPEDCLPTTSAHLRSSIALHLSIGTYDWTAHYADAEHAWRSALAQYRPAGSNALQRLLGASALLFDSTRYSRIEVLEVAALLLSCALDLPSIGPARATQTRFLTQLARLWDVARGRAAAVVVPLTVCAAAPLPTAAVDLNALLDYTTASSHLQRFVGLLALNTPSLGLSHRATLKPCAAALPGLRRIAAAFAADADFTRATAHTEPLPAALGNPLDHPLNVAANLIALEGEATLARLRSGYAAAAALYTRLVAVAAEHPSAPLVSAAPLGERLPSSCPDPSRPEPHDGDVDPAGSRTGPLDAPGSDAKRDDNASRGCCGLRKRDGRDVRRTDDNENEREARARIASIGCVLSAREVGLLAKSLAALATATYDIEMTPQGEWCDLRHHLRVSELNVAAPEIELDRECWRDLVHGTTSDAPSSGDCPPLTVTQSDGVLLPPPLIEVVLSYAGFAMAPSARAIAGLLRVFL